MIKKRQIKKFQKFYDLLQLLKDNCSECDCHEKFNSIVSYLDGDTVTFLAECTRNALAPSTFKHLKKPQQESLLKILKPYKKAIHKVIKPDLPLKHRKKYIQQGGAWFLPLLGSVIIPLISNIVKSVIPSQKQ